MWRGPSGKAIRQSLPPISETMRCESGHAGPTDWWPTLGSPCWLLHAADGALTKIFNNGNFVPIELQRHSSLHRQLPRHFSSGGVRWFAAHCVFDRFQAQRTSGGTIHRDAHAFDRAVRYEHRRGYVEQREIPYVAVAHFLKIKLRAGPSGRNANGREQIA